MGASQGVRTCAYLPSLPFYPPEIDGELALYNLCVKKNFNSVCFDVKDLPSTSVDIVLLALDDHEMLHQERSKPWHRAGIAWAKSPSSGLTQAYSSILWHTLAYSGILWHTLAYSGIL